ncbi:iron chaperone [Nocardia goodfellowii]
MATASKSGGQGKKAASEGFSELERSAVKERAAELRAQARRGRGKDKAAADEAEVLAKIAQMPESDRALAERVHAIVTAAAPELAPKLYYGQPAYARNGKVVCFFRSGEADKERYSTFGFSVEANLDEASGLWPTSYALTELTEDAWKALADLVRQAVS